MGDLLTVIGTEGDDSLVLTDGHVYGGGRTIDFLQVEDLEVLAQSGYDLVTQTSSSSNLATMVYGSTGTDQFVIGPRVVEPVVSRNLNGHRGILEHGIGSGDEEYDNLYVRGISVDVLGNDGDYGAYVNVYDPSGVVNHVLTEGSEDSFSFYVYPTTRPVGGPLVVNLVSQSDKDGERYLLLNGSAGAAIELFFDSMTPQLVTVKHNPAAERLSIKEYDVVIKVSVIYPETNDVRFESSDQSLLPVGVTLLPEVDPSPPTGALSVTVVEPSGKTIVAEGQAHAITATYDIYLRPCTLSTRNEVVVDIVPTVAGQVTLSKTMLNGADWLGPDDDCRVPITVTADDDSVSEGLHFTTLQHVVTESGTGNDLLLDDGSVLYATDVLVGIHDDDIAGVIIEEGRLSTQTAEINGTEATEDGLSLDYYCDSYMIRLSKQPSSAVTITVSSTAIASDRNYSSSFEVTDRDYTERGQLLLSDTSYGGLMDGDVVLTFTTDNWHQYQTVYVGAVDDLVEEGVDLLSFAPQASYLSYMQGPISVSGTSSGSYDAFASPMMMFMLDGETDAMSFTESPPAYDGDRNLTDSQQRENVEIYNLDVQGVAVSVGLLTDTSLTGLNMANDVEIEGVEQWDGIRYEGIEVLEIRLGDGVDEFTVKNVTTGMELLIRTRGEADDIYVDGLAMDVMANVYGGSEDDTIYIDGTDNWNEPAVNLLEGSRLRWNGELDDDTMRIKLGVVGTSDIDIFNDVDGINDVIVNCANSSSFVLSRENFLANIHNITDVNSTVERINLIRESDGGELTGFFEPATINSLVMMLNDGENVMYFDDTFAPMEVYGGPQSDGEWA